MSRIMLYGEEESTVVLDSKNECKYKTNGKCFNNRNIKCLGKCCHLTEKQQEECCSFYEKEKMKKGEKIRYKSEILREIERRLDKRTREGKERSKM